MAHNANCTKDRVVQLPDTGIIGWFIMIFGNRIVAWFIMQTALRTGSYNHWTREQ